MAIPRRADSLARSPRAPWAVPLRETAVTIRMAFVAVSYTVRRDGVSVYAENLLLELLRQAPRENVALWVDVYVCREAAAVLREVLRRNLNGEAALDARFRIIDLDGDGVFARYVRTPRQVRANGPYDVVFSPNLQPLWLPRRRSVAVLHDLTYRVAARHFPRWRVLYMDMLTRFWLRRGEAVASISRTTQDDLDRLYSGARGKPDLYLPNGLPTKLTATPRPDPDDCDAKFTDDPVEMLFVGRLNRLKGFDRVRAFAEHLDRHFRGAVRIHVVGKDTPDTPGLLEGMALDSVELIRHGYLDDDQLNALYRRCAYCLFPSRNEGFGLPLLEAIWQRCVPVLSEIAIFREVTGSGFPLFTADGDGIVRMTAFVERMRADPAYRREITDAMEGVLARWGDGYTRAARNLLAWSRPGRPHAMEVTRE